VASRHSSDSLVHVHRDRPVAVGLLQGDAQKAVRTLLHALLGHRRAQHVVQQSLPTRRIESARPRRRVLVEDIIYNVLDPRTSVDLWLIRRA